MTAFVAAATMTRAEFLEHIIRRFGIDPPTNANKPLLLDRLERHITEAEGNGLVPVIVIDDAHALSDELFDELRSLANAAVLTQRPLEILLVGLPALEARLAEPAFDAVRQRVSVRHVVMPFSQHETRRLLQDVLAPTTPEGAGFLPRKTCREIFTRTGGVARAINALVGESMNRARRAGSRIVTPDHVAAAAETVGSTIARTSSPPRPVAPPREAPTVTAKLSTASPLEASDTSAATSSPQPKITPPTPPVEAKALKSAAPPEPAESKTPMPAPTPTEVEAPPAPPRSEATEPTPEPKPVAAPKPVATSKPAPTPKPVPPATTAPTTPKESKESRESRESKESRERKESPEPSHTPFSIVAEEALRRGTASPAVAARTAPRREPAPPTPAAASIAPSESQEKTAFDAPKATPHREPRVEPVPPAPLAETPPAPVASRPPKPPLTLVPRPEKQTDSASRAAARAGDVTDVASAHANDASTSEDASATNPSGSDPRVSDWIGRFIKPDEPRFRSLLMASPPSETSASMWDLDDEGAEGAEGAPAALPPPRRRAPRRGHDRPRRTSRRGFRGSRVVPIVTMLVALTAGAVVIGFVRGKQASNRVAAPPSETDSSATKKSNATGKHRATTSRTKKASAKPAAQSDETAPATPSTPPLPQQNYALEVGSYLSQERAEEERDRIVADTGLKGWVIQGLHDGAETYAVVIGIYRTEERAQISAGALLERSVVSEASVIPLPPRRLRK